MNARFLCALVYTLGWVPLFLYRVEAMGESLPFYAGTERIAVWLTPILVSLHVGLACSLLTFAVPTPWWHPGAGAVVYAAALVFWAWGRLAIGPPRQRRLPHEPPLRFRRDGAFGLVRHPLYTSYVLAALAPLAATGSPLLLATFAAAFAAIAVRAEQEERRLRQQLGEDYEEYCRQVKRLVPFVW